MNETIKLVEAVKDMSKPPEMVTDNNSMLFVLLAVVIAIIGYMIYQQNNIDNGDN